MYVLECIYYFNKSVMATGSTGNILWPQLQVVLFKLLIHVNDLLRETLTPSALRVSLNH